MAVSCDLKSWASALAIANENLIEVPFVAARRASVTSWPGSDSSDWITPIELAWNFATAFKTALARAGESSATHTAILVATHAGFEPSPTVNHGIWALSITGPPAVSHAPHSDASMASTLLRV